MERDYDGKRRAMQHAAQGPDRAVAQPAGLTVGAAI
jgi:hypothetical protein